MKNYFLHDKTEQFMLEPTGCSTMIQIKDRHIKISFEDINDLNYFFSEVGIIKDKITELLSDAYLRIYNKDVLNKTTEYRLGYLHALRDIEYAELQQE